MLNILVINKKFYQKLNKTNKPYLNPRHFFGWVTYRFNEEEFESHLVHYKVVDHPPSIHSGIGSVEHGDFPAIF